MLGCATRVYSRILSCDGFLRLELFKTVVLWICFVFLGLPSLDYRSAHVEQFRHVVNTMINSAAQFNQGKHVKLQFMETDKGGW